MTTRPTIPLSSTHRHLPKPAKKPMLYLCFDTAALYWRAVREERLPFPSPLDATSVTNTCALSYGSLSRIDMAPLGVVLEREGLAGRFHTIVRQGPAEERSEHRITVPNGLSIAPGEHVPIHALTTDNRQKHTHPAIVVHLMKDDAPAGSFYRVSDRVAVTSPELTYLQLARRGRLLPCLELASEWCGTYVLRALEDGCSFDQRPLMSKASLDAYLQKEGCPRGAGLAQKMLRYVENRLASPLETKLYLTLVLPPLLGGRGFVKPEINQQIPLKGTDLAHLSAHPHLEVDLLWRTKSVVLEYDGFFDHERTPQQVVNDKEKRSLLAAMGYTVIVVTKRDLESQRSLERKIGQLALALGVKLGAPTAKEREAQEALFSWLFKSAHDHLPFGAGYR